MVTTTNKSLLMTNFMNDNKIHNNTIYICKAIDTLNYMKEQELSVIDAIKIYFPYLIKQEIVSLEQLIEKNTTTTIKIKRIS